MSYMVEVRQTHMWGDDPQEFTKRYHFPTTEKLNAFLEKNKPIWKESNALARAYTLIDFDGD